MTLQPSDVTIEVRAARAEDVPAAARLAAALVRQHHDYDPLRFMCLEPVEEGYERFLRSQIGREDVVLLVAVTLGERGGAVAGYVLGSLEPRDWSDLREACGKIHDLYVDASFRKHGIATGLLEAAVAQLEAMGAPRVVLMAAWRNEPARRLFDKLGFRATMLEMAREADAPHARVS
jgi:ribosomal protein S18 acetylase RimI-like enzyme